MRDARVWLGSMLVWALFVFSVGSSMGCSSGGDAAGRSTGAADGVAIVERGPFERVVLLTGELDADDAVSVVAPRADARQLTISYLVEDGATVRKGERLVAFDDSSFSSRLENQRVLVKQSKRDFTTQRQIRNMAVADKKNVEVIAALNRDKAALRADIDESLITERDHQERLLELERADAALKVARADLNSERQAAALDIKLKQVEVARAERELTEVEESIAKLSIAAPIDGVAMLNTHPWTGQKLGAGDTVWVGWSVVTLPNLTDLIIRANLSDVDDGQVVAGMKARVVFDADPEKALAGRVRKTSDIALEMGGEALRRAFDVIVELEDNGKGWARPGMSARVEVTSRALDDALLVPRGAIRWRDGKSLVLLEDGKEVPVTFEACNALRCALAVDTDGLVAGARLQVGAGT